MAILEDTPILPVGYVTGRYIQAIVDAPEDADNNWEYLPSKGKITFTPMKTTHIKTSPKPVTITQNQAYCSLDDEGYLQDPFKRRGVWLVEGRYAVKFEVEAAVIAGPKEIVVTTDYTPQNPLDLTIHAPIVPGPTEILVVDESAAVRAETAAKQAESIVTNIQAEVESVVAANPDLKGVGISDITSDTATGLATVTLTDNTTKKFQLPRGKDGETPTLTWNGTSLSVNGGAPVDLKGSKGDKGDSPKVTWNNSQIVVDGTSGPDLKGVKGDKGDPGSPGTLTSAASFILLGPGRPDTPSTTNGVITGSEPVGAEYRSTDGAGVGAWVWRKRPTGWEVVDGDTGWRSIGQITGGTDGVCDVRIMRVNSKITFQFVFTTGTFPTGNHRWVSTFVNGFIPNVWRHDNAEYGSPLFANIGSGMPVQMGSVAVLTHSAPQMIPMINITSNMGRRTAALVELPTVDSWPTTLPGTPA